MRKIISLFLGCLCFLHSISFAGLAEEAKMVATLMQQLNELKDQTEQLKRQTNSLKEALKAIERLDQSHYQWGDASTVINNLNEVLRKTDGLFYTSATLQSDFEALYPGYKAPVNYQQEYQKNVDSTLNTLDGVLMSMGASANDFKSESSRLSYLQSQVAQAEGQTQAIQASAQLLSELIVQLQLLRQTLIAQSNAQVSYYAQQLQKEASSQAEFKRFVQSGSTAVPAYGTSGELISGVHY